MYCVQRRKCLLSVVCTCAEYPTIRGVSDLYVNSPCNFPLYFYAHARLLQASAVCNMSCACCVEQRLAFALQKVRKGRLTLKRSSCLPFAVLMTDHARLLTGFGKSREYKCLPFYSITS